MVRRGAFFRALAPFLLVPFILTTLLAGRAAADDRKSTVESTVKPTVDANGGVHVRDLTIPVSSLNSAQFNEAYARHAAGVIAQTGELPQMSAPKAEWDRFFGAADQGMSAAVAALLKHYPADLEETNIAGVPVAIVTPKVSPKGGATDPRVLINVHGGLAHGLGQGKLESIPVAVHARLKVIALDYRGEPYHKYPAPSEDVAAVYRELLKRHKPSAIGIFGSSLGGVVTAQAVAWFAKVGLPKPGAIGIFWSGIPAAPFPWGGSGDSQLWEMGVLAKDPDAFARMLTNVGWYVRDVPATDAAAFPGSSDRTLAQFPPTLFLSGTRAHDLSAAVTGHARLLKLGVDSSLYVMEGGWHGADTATTGAPEEHDARAWIARWFDRRLRPK